MLVAQEILSTIFDSKTINKVKNQFKENITVTSFESEQMTFRILKNKLGDFNIEFLCTDNQGSFFKTIGIYHLEKGGIFSPIKIEMTLLNDFKNFYDTHSKVNTESIKTYFLDIYESTIIAAFSRETFNTVQEMYRLKDEAQSQAIINSIGSFPHLQAMQFDKSLISNGVKIDLFFSFDGYPQLYLDDEYDIEGAFAVYIKNTEGYKIHPTTMYDNIFRKLHQMELLEVYREH